MESPMRPLEDVAPNYLRAVEYWIGAPSLSNGYQALKLCYEHDAQDLVEHIKSFVETVCHTVLHDTGIRLENSLPSTTELLIASLKALGLENTRGASKLDKVLSAFNRLSDALTEMRNDNSTVAHGKDGFLDALLFEHRRTFLHA